MRPQRGEGGGLLEGEGGLDRVLTVACDVSYGVFIVLSRAFNYSRTGISILVNLGQRWLSIEVDFDTALQKRLLRSSH